MTFETEEIFPTPEQQSELLARILRSPRFANLKWEQEVLRCLFDRSRKGITTSLSQIELKQALGLDSLETTRSSVSRTKQALADYYQASRSNGASLEIRVKIPERSYRAAFFPNHRITTLVTRDVAVEAGSRKAIAVLVASGMDWFVGELTAGAEQAARHFGYAVVFASSEDDPAQEANQISALPQHVGGIAVVPVSNEDPVGAFERLRESAFPFVFADRFVRGFEDVSLVGSDGRYGGVVATDYLLREHGCKRVFVLAERSVSTLEDRIAGWRQALAGVGILPPDTWERRTSLRDETAGFQLMKELLQSEELRSGDGIFATNDVVAFGVRGCLDRLGKTNDIPVVGFDGRKSGRYFFPPLPSVKQDFRAIGAKAVEVLIRQIEEPTTPRAFHPVRLRLLRRQDPENGEE